MGKSAQVFLHIWLPDAMEGPTPVSALIHAATMVTAGVYLVAKCSPIFEYSVFTLKMITIVGALIAFFASTVGLVQNDMKKIIAYSTCSQLGYMFFACGLSNYASSAQSGLLRSIAPYMDARCEFVRIARKQHHSWPWYSHRA
ncbi:hypothetical protein DYB26_008101 [Aphanomyces astaci]|uniref:NADH:quinone oxidoreductase/Mrp antiporter transmembrane domain-containing protein n=1 Tax=Aphanomyces astaci TaxID=112090 RepID=A0A3R6YBW8_APHAT|nr:hypothetical protein DYB26_008101 [Aphanomyces astaci]